MKTHQQIKLGSVLSYLSIFLNILAGFICTPLIIKSLGQSSYGVYTLAFSIMNMLLIDFGLGSATSRYVAKYRSEGNQQAVNDIFGLILKLFIILSLILGVFFAIWIAISPSMYKGLSATEIHSFQISFMIVSIYSIISFPFVTFDGILTAYEKFVQAKLITIINRLVLTGSLLVCVFLNLGLYSLIICHAIAGAILIITKLFFVFKYTPARPNLSFKSKSMLKDVATFSLWVTIATLANRLLFNICPTILGVVTSSGEIAKFGLVATVESYIYVFATAINGMFLATITRIFLEKEPIKKLQDLLIKVGKYQFFVNGLIVCGFIVLGLPFIKWWVGTDYIDSYYGIILVIVPGVFYNSLQIANTTMIVTKKIKYHAFTEIITGVVNVSLCFPLAMKFGAIGACVSICIALCIRTFIDNLICIFILKIPMKKFYFSVYFRMSISLVLATMFGILATYGIGYIDKFSFVRIGILVVVLYFIFSLVIGFNHKERSYLFNKIVNRGKKNENK